MGKIAVPMVGTGILDIPPPQMFWGSREARTIFLAILRHYLLFPVYFVMNIVAFIEALRQVLP